MISIPIRKIPRCIRIGKNARLGRFLMALGILTNDNIHFLHSLSYLSIAEPYFIKCCVDYSKPVETFITTPIAKCVSQCRLPKR